MAVPFQQLAESDADFGDSQTLDGRFCQKSFAGFICSLNFLVILEHKKKRYFGSILSTFLTHAHLMRLCTQIPAHNR